MKIYFSERWNEQTSKIKEVYDKEIHEVRQSIDDTVKDYATTDLRAKRAEEEKLKLKEKYTRFFVS